MTAAGWLRALVVASGVAILIGCVWVVSAGGESSLPRDERPAASDERPAAPEERVASTKRDRVRPTAPTGIRLKAQFGTVLIAWTPSTDNVGVTGYDVFLGSKKRKLVRSPSWRLTGLACGRVLPLAVVARDRAGNRSPVVKETIQIPGCSASRPGWTGGFDTGDLSQWSFVHQYTPDRFRVVAADGAIVPRQGSHMARSEVRYKEPTSWWASMNVASVQKNGLPNVGLGNDVYMGWSIYLPNDFSYVPNTLANLLVEWHAEAPMSQAPFHFGINGYDGQFYVDLHTSMTGYRPVLQKSVGPMVKGRWVDCVIRTRWAQDSSGIIEFWMDGVKKFSWTGRTWGMQRTVYPVAGYYRTDYNATAVVYFDALKVGTSYEAVAP